MTTERWDEESSAASVQRWRRFRLDGRKPERIIVRDITPPEHATRMYAVVADYGWAETILAGDCYDHTANDLAAAVGYLLKIPFEEIEVTSAVEAVEMMSTLGMEGESMYPEEAVRASERNRKLAETSAEPCPFCGCPGERYDGHVCEDYEDGEKP